MGNYNSSDSGGYNSGTEGLVVGLVAGAALGYAKWGKEGLLLGIIGAIVGSMGQTALTAGRAGRASLLLALLPLGVFGAIAYVVWRYFRHGSPW